jgi:26S proteasome non-ATPase regulatory subunit 9
MDKSLIDGEGFPLADIDHYAVRNARSRVIALKNDHKAVMKFVIVGATRFDATG